MKWEVKLSEKPKMTPRNFKFCSLSWIGTGSVKDVIISELIIQINEEIFSKPLTWKKNKKNTQNSKKTSSQYLEKSKQKQTEKNKPNQ